MKAISIPAFFLFMLVALGATACGSDSSEPAPDDDGPTDDSAPIEDPGSDSSLPDDEPLGGGPYPVGEVQFMVTQPDGTTQTYSVSCLGDTATVFGDLDTSADTIGSVTGDRMCLALADQAVRSRLIEGEPPDQVCTEIYGSGHTAEVSGTLDGTDFSASFHRSNGCGIDDWDQLMSDLLPPV